MSTRLEVKIPKIEGERYEGTIPDTLDLADRAKLALNGLAGCLSVFKSFTSVRNLLVQARCF